MSENTGNSHTQKKEQLSEAARELIARHGRYAFFRNSACEYFPCHAGADESGFNCLFCYCPLYALGENCGGNCSYTPDGIKDCSACLLPHSPQGYDYIMSRYPALAELAKRE